VGRVLLVLILACLVATFFIINNSSLRPATISASPKTEEAKQKSEKERSTKREKESRARISTKSSAIRPQATNFGANSVKSAGTSKESGVADDVNVVQDPSHATVKGDDTPVYSVNSKDSSIVKLLNKGDWVSTDLDVIDVKGRWTIVKKSDLSKPGFVQPENLQQANAAKKKEKK
jgi:hypothetical protein